jgi:hypothetical protein
MALSTSTAEQIFNDNFTITIQLLVQTGTDPDTGLPTTSPLNEVPKVTADITDSGIKIIPGNGTITISGAYTSIVPITWTWLDLSYNSKTAKKAPDFGTYKKIVEAVPPPLGTYYATYTITSSAGVDTFTMGVVFNDYTIAANILQSLLEKVPIS